MIQAYRKGARIGGKSRRVTPHFQTAYALLHTSSDIALALDAIYVPRPPSVVRAVKLVAAESPKVRVSISALGTYLRRTDPSFSPQTYGHAGLVNTLKTFDLLELR